MEDVEISMLPAAPDATIVTRLTEIVNQAYLEGEKGLWRDNAGRTTAKEMAGLAAQGQLAVARRADTIIGTVRVRQLAPGLGQLGMLAADPRQRGGGVGRELVRFAEDHARAAGATTMQLELLVPLAGEHPVKEFLRTWYTRIGYARVGTASLADDHPELAPRLAVPCELLVFHKPL
ncbi:GNAT family N-acetyltransferase [Actinoplanes sp. RD1]|uniref:GNAT family N-acetyltransferase n=1 Tax=Actinoplanes sp. RD1 TaxID=3064538 RepID=UPI002740A863|nr:GNAT family N-acetyltransferase [Actinoplanes sp. RD1]